MAINNLLGKIVSGDCREVMKEIPDDSVDSIVTDPPYELGFMGKEWDKSGIAYQVEVWEECLRVLKPGGHLLAFGGSRTYHRLACAVEDAGFEIRDQIIWIYGSGFPKSLDISKAIDKAAGAEREDKFGDCFDRKCGPTGNKRCDSCGKWLVSGNPCKCPRPQDQPKTDSGKLWSGWGTALKPAHEPIVLARKPLIGTVAQNVLKHGTGGINIDGCRVETEDVLTHGGPLRTSRGDDRTGKALGMFQDGTPNTYKQNPQGRWPANVIHDGSEEVVGKFPDVGKSTGGRTIKRSGGGNVGSGKLSEKFWSNDDPGYGDSGSAARFFYCAKASREDREWAGAENRHPTVKPLDLMKYLCRLVTPPAGIVLDPFAGSGSTCRAALTEGFKFIGIEIDEEYTRIANARLNLLTAGLPFGMIGSE